MSLTSMPTAFSKWPAAVITGPESLRNVYISDKTGEGPTVIKTDFDERCMLSPTRDPSQRDCGWIYGSAGSGKSRWVRLFAQEYRKIWGRKRPIVVISQIESDVSLPMKDWVDMKRISVKSLAEKRLDLEEFESYGGALVIFDDVDALPTKAEEEAVHLAQQLIASQGRSHGPGRQCSVSMLITSHVPSNYAKTRMILSESNIYVCFSHGCSVAGMTRLLSVFGGLDREQIKMLRRLPSRWVACKRTYPPLYCSENEVGLLHVE